MGNNVGAPYAVCLLPPAPNQNPSEGQKPPIGYNPNNPSNYPSNVDYLVPGFTLYNHVDLDLTVAIPDNFNAILRDVNIYGAELFNEVYGAFSTVQFPDTALEFFPKGYENARYYLEFI